MIWNYSAEQIKMFICYQLEMENWRKMCSFELNYTI